MKKSMKGKNNPMFGKKHSEETKKQISETRIKKGIAKGQNNPMYGIRRFGKENPMFGKKRPDIAEYNKKHKSEQLRGKNHPNYGKENKWGRHTEETKRKMSKLLKGRKVSWGNKISKTKKEQFLNGEYFSPMLGKKHTEETKKKIGLLNKGKIVSEETKKKLRKIRTLRIFPLKDTSIEIKIQNFLKQLNIDFFTHQYIKEIEHGYQCDIFIPSKNLVIECDGNYWHKYPIGKEIDHIRTSELIEKGFKVLRLWEFEIKSLELNEFESKLQGVL